MRDYDPTLGRYLQADPLGLVDGASIYGYVMQNPGRYVDPRGECVGPAAAVCAGAIGGVVGGFIADQIWGDGCYTWEEALNDALVGAVYGGVLAKLSNVAYSAGVGYSTGVGYSGGRGFVPASAPVGRQGAPLNNLRGTPTRNADEVVNGRPYTGHALDSAQNRGLTPSVVDDAIKNGAKSPDPLPGRVRNYSPENNVTVVTEGRTVVTIIPGKR